MSLIRRKVPLSFQGNKSNHIEDFINYIEQCSAHTYIDLFGGSCYLSYVIHKLKPNVRVICNDYDNYRERLVNVDTTNEIINAIRSITNSKRQTQYSPEQVIQIKQIISDVKNKDRFIDSISLSSCLCFSGTYKTKVDDLLSMSYYYNNLPKKNYETKWYLDSLEGIEFVRTDWHDLFNKYKDEQNICFVADPPYLGTDKSSYSSKFWGLLDSMETVLILKQPLFAYYSSEKSELQPMIEFLNKNYEKDNPIEYQTFMIRRGGVNHSAKPWNDLLLTNK